MVFKRRELWHDSLDWKMPSGKQVDRISQNDAGMQKSNKGPKYLNGHLSNKDSTLTSWQRVHNCISTCP